MGIFNKKNNTETNEELLAKAKRSKKRKIKAVFICILVIIYTAVVAFITVKVDRKILANSLETAFEEAFASELGTEEEKDEKTSSEKEDKDTTSSSKKENSSDKSSSNKDTSDKSSSSEGEENSTENDELIIDDSDDTVFVANDMFMIEHVCEVEILGADFSKKISSPSGSASHNSFESKKAGYQYLDFKINYENLEKALVNVEQITSVRILVGGTDYYNSFSLIENEDGNLVYTSSTPISSGKIGKLHYLFNVPDSVANGSSRIVAVITIRGKTYEYVIR